MRPLWTAEIYQKAQLKNDSVQAFDAKWDEVLSAVTDRLAKNILEGRYKMQIESRKSWHMCCKSSLKRRHSATRNTTFAHWSLCCRDISSRKIKDSHFKARNRDDDRPAMGAPSKGKAGKGKFNAKNNSEREDCVRWITKGQCSFADACAFNHEPNKKDKGKWRLRSLSPTGLPHRNSKGDGQDSDDRGAKGTPTLTGKSPSGKVKWTDYFV